MCRVARDVSSTTVSPPDYPPNPITSQHADLALKALPNMRISERIARLEGAAPAHPRTHRDLTQVSDGLLAELEAIPAHGWELANAHPYVQWMLAEHGNAPLTDVQMRLFVLAAKENHYAAS